MEPVADLQAVIDKIQLIVDFLPVVKQIGAMLVGAVLSLIVAVTWKG